VRIYQTRQLQPAAITAAYQAASEAGATAVLFESGMVGLLRARRAGVIVHAAPTGYRYPVSIAATSFRGAIGLYGRPVARALAHDDAVMSRASAEYRGLQVGDVLDLYGWNRAVRRVRIGALSELIPGEVLVSEPVAKRLGMRRPSFVVLHGFSSRTAVMDELNERSAVFGRARFVGSWMDDPADDTLSSWQLKMVLGEFAIRGTTKIRVYPSWSSVNLRSVNWKMGERTVTKVCHRVIADATELAFERINEAGLARYLDAKSTQQSGGCYHPRMVRAIGSTSGGNLSVHSWGGALDFNVSTNCLGCTPTLNCEIVQIFRELGFAWGGNFLTPDGMHFEWVGEPRHQTPTRPGEYCPTGGLLGPSWGDAGTSQSFGTSAPSDGGDLYWDHLFGNR